MNEPQHGEESEFISQQKRLIQRLNAPETREETARELVDLYSREMYLKARAQLNRAFSRRFDPEDVLQTVFRTFFRRSEQFEDATDRELRLILMAITVNKSISLARKHTGEGRDIRKEECADPNFLVKHIKLSPDRPLKVRSIKGSAKRKRTQPSRNNDTPKSVSELIDEMDEFEQPDQALILQELIMQVPEQLQPVLILMYEGYSQQEIAELLKCAPRSVIRKKANLMLYFQTIVDDWEIPTEAKKDDENEK